MVWRFWITFDSEQSASATAGWLGLHYGGRNATRPTIRFRNLLVQERVVMVDVTYIARSANTNDVNRVIAKACIAVGGHWDTSVRDMVFILLWGQQRGDAGERSTWPNVSDQDYANGIRRHEALLPLIGGAPAME